MNIKKFIINKNEKQLTINFFSGKPACVSFEYLRVFTPKVAGSSKQQALVTHKKSIVLSAIENVGKHGYRFTFDDQHSAIYSAEYLLVLVNEHKQRWQHYLAELKSSAHSREAIINITQL